MRNIHIIMTREDGSEEGNQWEFDGSDNLLQDMFDYLCQVIIDQPRVVLPEVPTAKKLFEFVFRLPVLLYAAQSQIAECAQLGRLNGRSTTQELRLLAERAVREYINEGSRDRGDDDAPFAVEVEDLD